MTAGENMADSTFVALHGLHHVWVAMEHLDHWEDWVVTNLHESNLTINLVE